MANDGLFIERRLRKPLARAGPAFVFHLVFGKMRFCPHGLGERREAFIEPDIPPVLAGDQIAKPLVGQLM